MIKLIKPSLRANRMSAAISKKYCFVAMLLAMTLGVTGGAQAQEKLPDACKLIPDHNNVAYQPGVDVDGNAVVPADLNAGHQLGDILNVVKVPLEFDLAQRIGGLNTQGVDLDTTLGMLEIHQSGRVLYNGQDITKPVMTICAKSHKEVTVDIVEVEKPAMAEKMTEKEVIVPTKPIAPEFNEAAMIEKTVLPSKLAIDSAEEAFQMPAVSAPIVEAVEIPKVSQPDVIKQPLIGTPKIKNNETVSNIKTANDDGVIKGQDYRDYNE